MATLDHLHHKLAVLQQNLLHGKLPRDVAWDDAVSLITHLGRVEAHGGEEVTFVVGGERALFKRPHSGEFDLDEASRLRKFLKAAVASASPSVELQPCRLIVVVDHHVAHIYRDMDGSRPQALNVIEPDDPHHYHHHLIHRKESHFQGGRVPEDHEFYAQIAQALVPANEIVVIGHGVGKSNAASVLMEYLNSHAPHTARLVKAVEVADLSALTEPQIELIAKRHMISAV